MNERIRTAKQLAGRVNRGYLKQVFGIPRWRGVLTLLFLAVALAWLGFSALTHDPSPYTSGPLTPSHAFLGHNCAACHDTKAGVGHTIQDASCAACHSAPEHNANQAVTPGCMDCHVEHRGTPRLEAKSNQSCVACHSSMKTKNSKTVFAASINSFEDHPQFAAARPGAMDPGGIRFNHKHHVGDLGQSCDACHQVSSEEPPLPAGAHQRPHAASRPRAYMTQPTYAAVCSTCHPLNVDAALEPVPHDKPEVVNAFLREGLTKYIASHSAELGKNGLPASPAAWVNARIEADAVVMAGREQCGRCHGSLDALSNGIPKRWFAHAAFDHSTHQQIVCTSCHPGGATSTASSDVLIPGIDTCRNCHNSSSASAGELCSTCHVYHDWGKAKGVAGTFTIPSH